MLSAWGIGLALRSGAIMDFPYYPSWGPENTLGRPAAIRRTNAPSFAEAIAAGFRFLDNRTIDFLPRANS